ncbi:uncharacterized protein LOC141913153 [Tubulanus polymorphus]|uniref:uncharacterized protein LOC141913153 n=1 Tax=Tubulanus polymorphus TaxID=672921 RepID=UPI003DA1E5FB
MKQSSRYFLICVLLLGVAFTSTRSSTTPVGKKAENSSLDIVADDREKMDDSRGVEPVKIPRCPTGYYFNVNERICKNCTTCGIHDILNNLCATCGRAYHLTLKFFRKDNANEDSSVDGGSAGRTKENDDSRIYRFVVGDDTDDEDDDTTIDVLPTSNDTFWKRFSMCLIGILACVMVLFVLFVIVACRRDVAELRAKSNTIELLSSRARLFSRDCVLNEYVLNQQLLLPSSAITSGDKQQPEIRIAPDGTQFIDEIFTQEDSAGKRVATAFRLPLLDDERANEGAGDENDTNAGRAGRTSSLWTEMNYKTNQSLQKIDLGNVTPSRSRPASAILPSTSRLGNAPSPV